jgi:hypothetical protein
MASGNAAAVSMASLGHLAEVLAEFCSYFDPRSGGGFQSGKQRLAANA